MKGLARKVPVLVNLKQVHSLLRDKAMLSPVPARNKCVDHSALTDALIKETLKEWPLSFARLQRENTHKSLSLRHRPSPTQSSDALILDFPPSGQ